MSETIAPHLLPLCPDGCCLRRMPRELSLTDHSGNLVVVYVTCCGCDMPTTVDHPLVQAYLQR